MRFRDTLFNGRSKVAKSMPSLPGNVQLVACAIAALLLPVYVGAFVAPGAGNTPAVKGRNIRISLCAASATTAEAAKENLKDALAANQGSTLSAEVVAATEELAKFNPPSSTAKAWSLQCGDWLSIGQYTKGTTRTPDGLECTLGRLAFSIFEPVTLPILMTEIVNTIGPRAEGAEPTDHSFYNNCIRWVARDGSGLKGIAEIEGVCWEHPTRPNDIMVTFTKGTIRPDEGQDLDAWRKVIGVKDESQKNGPLSVLKERAAKLFLKVAFGFIGPASSQGPAGELTYKLKRSPKASLEILYLDDELRITRGSKGALVVTARA